MVFNLSKYMAASARFELALMESESTALPLGYEATTTLILLHFFYLFNYFKTLIKKLY